MPFLKAPLFNDYKRADNNYHYQSYYLKACSFCFLEIYIFVDLLFYRDSLFALENSRHFEKFRSVKFCLFLITSRDLKGQGRSLYFSSNYLLNQGKDDSRLVLRFFSDAK